MYTKELMIARAEELRGQISAIEAVSGPLRANRDTFSQDVHRRLSEMNAAIRDAEAPLADLKQELALLSKAVGGKTLKSE